MDYNDFKEFFKVHIKQYGPYKDSKMFQLFSNFLMNSYYEDSYNTIPNTFKEAFEKQVITSEFVSPFLQSLGIPLTVVNKLTNQDRFKIINSLSDFHRYKGTIQLVDNLVTNFDVNDNVAIYELYLDMHIDATGKKVWDVLPKLIKAGISFQPSLELKSAELFALLDQAQNWFIDEFTLGSLYDAGEIILPYKTNCILLDSTIINNIEPIIQIVSALIIETLKDEKIQLFFNNGVYLTTVSAVNIIWNYIFRKRFNKGNSTITTLGESTYDPTSIFDRYVIPNSDGTLSRGGSELLDSPLTNIQTMIDAYNALSTTTENAGSDITNFYLTYISIFSSNSISRNMTFNEYRTSVIGFVGQELVDYIDGRLDNAVNIQNESNLITSEIFSSLLTFKFVSASTINMDYFDYYILNLPGLIKDIKNSTTYMLLNFLKPYHSDLIARQSEKTICNSIFNNALVGYSKVFQITYIEHQLIQIVNNDNFKITTIEYDNALIVNGIIFDVIYTSLSNPDRIDITHSIIQNYITTYITSSVTSDALRTLFRMSANDSFSVSDALRILSFIYISPILDTQMVTADNLTANSLISKVSVDQCIDALGNLFQSTPVSERVLITDILRVLSFAYIKKSIIISNENILKKIKFEKANNVTATDAVSSYIYDNPVTGIHIVYTT